MEFLTNMLWDWPVGTIIGALIVACLAVVVFFVLYGVFVAFDSWFLPRKQSLGRIADKNFTPAYTQTVMIYDHNLKTTMPHFIPHPDRWSLVLEVGGQQGGISVDAAFYDAATVGHPVMVEYVKGRHSGGLYVKKVTRT